MSALVLLAAALALLAVAAAVRNRHRNALIGRLPGPLFLPVLGSVLEMLVKVVWLGRDQMALGAELRRRYGSVYVLWTGHLPYVLISNAPDAEVVLTHPATADKGTGYQLVEPWLGDGLLLTGGPKWHARRKVIAPAFGVKVLEQFCSMFNKQAAILEGKLRRRVDQGPFDVVPEVSLCALDIISETAMGVPINAQTQEDSDYVKAVKNACQCFFLRQVYPWLRFEPLFRLSNVGKVFYGAVDVLHGMTHRVINQRKKEMTVEMAKLSAQEDDVGQKQKAVLLDHLLSKSLRGEDISDQDITDEVNTFLFAGHDTTMTSLCFTLHLLSLHGDVQDAVAREARDVTGDAGDVLPEHLGQLRYLECVIKESLRLYPSVPFIVRNCKQDFTLPSGYTIPKGAQVGVDIVNLHRDEDTFPRPLDFDPDRFLPDRGQGRHSFAYIPFSASQRNCIGQRYAMMEMKTVLARLVRSFRILPPSEKYRPVLRSEVVLVSKAGVLVQLQRRAA